MERRPGGGPTENGLGREIERKLWAAADKLRGSMDAAEYKHVVLGLIFLKYISDAFEARREQLAGRGGRGGRSRRTATSTAQRTCSGCRSEARWAHLRRSAKQPTIGS